MPLKLFDSILPVFVIESLVFLYSTIMTSIRNPVAPNSWPTVAIAITIMAKNVFSRHQPLEETTWIDEDTFDDLKWQPPTYPNRCDALLRKVEGGPYDDRNLYYPHPYPPPHPQNLSFLDDLLKEDGSQPRARWTPYMI